MHGQLFCRQYLANVVKTHLRHQMGNSQRKSVAPTPRAHFAPAVGAAAPNAAAAAPLQKRASCYINADKYRTAAQMKEAMKLACIESANLIFAIDLTASNLTQGAKTFGGRSLHALGANKPNPYQQVMGILGPTLEYLDEDRKIPTFGFGCLQTKNTALLSLNSTVGAGDEKNGGAPAPEEMYCIGFQDALRQYERHIPHIQLNGPTSFAPAIYQAIEIVRKTQQYHILVIIADGTISESEEDDTKQAILLASQFPLSIIVIGVGDGPFTQMEVFDDELPERKFDNFQFVNFTETIKSAQRHNLDPKDLFIVSALQEIPEQYQSIARLKLFSSVKKEPQRHVPKVVHMALVGGEKPSPPGGA